MTDCLFCSIASGDIPADIVGQTANLVAFRDINPQAPTHFLVIPREHYQNLGTLSAERPALVAELAAFATETARAEGLADGYRVVFNTGPAAGQSVDHVHAHVLGGRQLSWPPG